MNDVCAAVLAACMSTARDEAAPGAVASELVAIARELMDAVGGGSREVWERRLAPQVSCVDPDGTVKGREAVLAELQPLPSGVSGRMELREPALTLSGDTAVLTYHARETEHAFGRTLSAAYRVSDVYVRRGGRWLLLASHATRLPASHSAEGRLAAAGGRH